MSAFFSQLCHIRIICRDRNLIFKIPLLCKQTLTKWKSQTQKLKEQLNELLSISWFIVFARSLCALIDFYREELESEEGLLSTGLIPKSSSSIFSRHHIRKRERLELNIFFCNKKGQITSEALECRKNDEKRSQMKKTGMSF